jgi:hypothetical protein
MRQDKNTRRGTYQHVLLLLCRQLMYSQPAVKPDKRIDPVRTGHSASFEQSQRRCYEMTPEFPPKSYLVVFGFVPFPSSKSRKTPPIYPTR